MKTLHGGLALACAVLFSAGTAIAGPVAPGDVKFEDIKVPASLTGQPGDPEKGKEWMINRRLGNCLACHEVTDLKDQPFHGNVGPSLDGVAGRYDEATLRAILVNSKKVFGDETSMPSFYRDAGYFRPRPEFVGKTIMSAEQVEDVVAYLMTLKD